ncbi:MAG: Ser-Thr-rich GPI-anchored membrane family protein [Lentimicrobiaceae bacterium]|nr:Ser-Thr-rich GPI-anchored membrane family protein [Lentimicrobiaceae bacterium]
MKKTLLLSCLLCVCTYLCSVSTAYGQTVAHTFDLSNVTYTQNFTIPEFPYAFYPTGWKGIKVGGTWHRYGIGDSIPLECKNSNPVGLSGIILVGFDPGYYWDWTDRALGTRASDFIIPAFGAVFKNNTGYKITKIDFSGVCEQWCTGSSSFVIETIEFEISFNATDLYDVDATWTRVNSFDLVEIRNDFGVSQSIDGNESENRRSISATYENAQWQQGSNMWIRWTDKDDVGNDALLAIDDLSITVTPEIKVIPEGFAHIFDIDHMTYNQNFDGMGATGTSYPTGWTGYKKHGNNTPLVGALLPLQVSDGSSGNAGMHNVGESGQSDRAMGSISYYGVTVPTFGAVFKNNTGKTISKLDFTGVCEQWRAGGSMLGGSTFDERHIFEISYDATYLNDTSATWTPVSSFDLYEIQTGNTSSEKLNGNLPANRQEISATLNNINWQTGTNIWIRWNDDQAPANNALLAIDDLSVTATLADPILTVTCPKAGAKWENGSTHNITWKQVSISDNIKIELINVYGSVQGTLAENVTATNGSWTWNIPVGLPSGSGYKIRLTAGAKVAESGIFDIISPSSELVAFTFDANNLIYDENFDGLLPDGTTYLTGWKGVNKATGDPLALQVSNGTPDVVGAFNVGTTNEADRALGTRAGDIQPRFGAVFKNNTGSRITKINFSGFCEQWRTGNNSNNESSQFAISFDATNLNDGTWTNINDFNLNEILTGDNSGQGVDGNLAANRQAINASSINLEWEQGDYMWIRWTDDLATGSNALLAIDDLQIAVTPVPSISVISPKAWDNWQYGTTYNITWAHVGITHDVKIELKDVTSGTEWVTIAENIPISNGSWDWYVPNNQTPHSYRIKLTAGGKISESAIFNVVQKYIGVNYPNTLSKWVQGTSQDILWGVNGIASGNAKIELTRNASAANPVWEELAASVPVENRAWTWNITQNGSNDCKIKITRISDDYSAQSETFSIVDATEVPKIFITEYIVGTGNNKALEIYNGTGSNINLIKLKIRVTQPDATYRDWLFNNIILAAGDVYVLYHYNANASIKDYGNEYYSYFFEYVDGDGAIEVFYDGVVCDLFGKIGDNPASGAWEVAGVANATKDKTLLRKLNVTKGNYMPKGSFGTTAENSEWVVKEKDYFGNIGGFGSALTQSTNTGLDASYDVPISDSNDSTFNLIINNNSVDVNNCVGVNSKLNNVNNVILKKSGNTTFTINPNSNLGIAGMAVDKSPTKDGTVSFNILSDNTGTGALMHDFITAGDIKRYISGNTILTANCYHGVSVPLEQGTNLVSNLFNGSYLYKFNETLNQWEGMGSATNTQLYADRGYLIYYPGASITYNFDGTFNYGFFPIPYTSTAADKGFNFVPNPFPSHIDFSEIENFPTSLSYGFWVWDNGNYKAYNVPAGTGTTTNYDTISIGQAFFVKATSAGTLSLTNKCRVGNRADKLTPFYSTGNQPNKLRIAANGNQLQDEILFVIDNKWNLGTDEGDMVKMIGSEEAPQLSSISADNENLTINTLPLNRYETVIPLSFTLNASTQVQFVADNRSLQSNITPYLIDKKENRSVNLRQNPVYTFNHANTDSDNRFELKLVNAVYSTPYDLADENMIYVNSNNQIIVSVPSMQNTKTMVNVYDMQGKLVSSNSVYLTDTFVTQAPVVSGVYVVSVVNSVQAVNKKVVVTR